jgi:paraquat-inducible protein A
MPVQQYNLSPEDYIACHSCDLLHLKKQLQPHEKAICSRCGEYLYGSNPYALEVALALSIASLLLFISAHTLPFISIDAEGNKSTIYLISTINVLSDLDSLMLSTAGILFLLVAPLSVLLINTVMLFLLNYGRSFGFRFARQLLLVAGHITPWNMLEIFLLGTLVSLVKLASMADIALHEGFWAFVALVIINFFIAANISTDTLWKALEKTRH